MNESKKVFHKATLKVNPSQTDIDRFWSYVIKTGNGDCWNWTGCRYNSGYGAMSIKDRPFLPHRLSWIINNGNIPEGFCVLHKCDNRLCCNPAHLFLGTLGDNNSDRNKKGRSANGEKNGNAKLTNSQVVEMRKRRKGGEKLLEIAKDYGVTKSVVGNIVSFKTWKHIGP